MSRNWLVMVENARFNVLRLSHEKWEWVCELEKDGITTLGKHPKKQPAVEAAYNAWKIQKAQQVFPGEPPVLGVKTTEHMKTSDKVR